MNPSTTPPRLPPRPTDAHKRSVGRVLVVGGSASMPGAPALAALGALRAGAGLALVAVPQGIQAIVAGYRPETMTLGLPQTRAGALGSAALPVVRQFARDWDALVLGPGLGRGVSTVALVRALVRSVACPLVLDADGLFALGAEPELLRGREGVTLITPHEGEAARLLDEPADTVHADRAGAVARLAERSGAIVVLKGPGTLVCAGESLYRNRTGGAVLATGGTGDVLSGVLAALLAGSGVSAFDAACIGVFAHGAAGDALSSSGDRGWLASELAAGIPAALHTLATEPSA